MSITCEKGLKIKDYQKMINDRDNNLKHYKLLLKDKFRLGMFYGYILGSSLTFLFCYLLFT